MILSKPTLHEINVPILSTEKNQYIMLRSLVLSKCQTDRSINFDLFYSFIFKCAMPSLSQIRKRVERLLTTPTESSCFCQKLRVCYLMDVVCAVNLIL